MLESCGWVGLEGGVGGMALVAHEILVTAQRPNSFFPFLDLTFTLLGFGLGLGLGLVIVFLEVLTFSL